MNAGARPAESQELWQGLRTDGTWVGLQIIMGSLLPLCFRVYGLGFRVNPLYTAPPATPLGSTHGYLGIIKPNSERGVVQEPMKGPVLGSYV